MRIQNLHEILIWNTNAGDIKWPISGCWKQHKQSKNSTKLNYIQ